MITFLLYIILILLNTYLNNRDSPVTGKSIKFYALYCDCGKVEYHDFEKLLKMVSVQSVAKNLYPFLVSIEVGNIFQLGTKYSKAMDMPIVCIMNL